MKDDKKQISGFAKRMKEIREFLNLNQREMANRLGVSESKISEYETGQHMSHTSFIEIIADKLNVSANYLVLGKGKMFLNHEGDIEAKANKMGAANNEDTDYFSYVFERSPLVRYMCIAQSKKLLIVEKEGVYESMLKPNENFEEQSKLDFADDSARDTWEVYHYFKNSSIFRYNMLGYFRKLIMTEKIIIEEEIKQYEEKKNEDKLKIDTQDSTPKKVAKIPKKKAQSKRK